MSTHLIMSLEAPLMSFGGDMVDAFGVVRDFPARSMITGLIANALGWDRAEADLHQALQARLIMGSVRLREGRRVRDFQTAQLGAADKGWTTRGKPEGRAGGAGTYNSPHIRYRDADADALVLVALRLEPVEAAPDLGTVTAALNMPERPLFIGRKPFLPSGPLVAGHIDAATVLDALRAAIARFAPAPAEHYAAQWPLDEGSAQQARIEELTDERNWPAGVHAGLRRTINARIGGEAA
ncbi:type I-E CRISPR-associated protein Cas5/CasD [Novosphingobium sp. PC22D]|uniref:type I-E CRISPR-associated protein Cas5/CasD n=1 Tax=Novosphingobium sp. PC22D TaxID=1962403 RepID=UPI000BEF7C49|nr:type I-E CRISPR-associated protein Cas5/CasD [Novosphingobium sp. PC22D]PEQ12680.1 type I-E CRISPR-associated protein Cas5/CasD [Novosphingobium sp. PC22D]